MTQPMVVREEPARYGDDDGGTGRRDTRIIGEERGRYEADAES